ncbi:MAG: ATP-binding protein [Janthinobacterium lividum]
MAEAGTRSINRKLAQLVIVAVGAAMAVVAVLAVWQEGSRYLDSKRDILLATANAFAAATGDALAARDGRAADLALRGIASLPAIQFTDLQDLKGRSVAQIGSGVRLRGDLDLSERDGGTTPLGLLMTRTVSVSVAVRKEGQAIGRLVLVGDVTDLPSRLIGTLKPIAFGSAAALAIGLAISLRLQRSITRPLIALTRLMGSVQADHDYTCDVTIESDDEIGLLARSFRAMLREVWERDRQLVAHRDHLEREVADRTVDLRLAKDDAEAANAAKSDFLATMSHEIRTPMNGMLVMAELLASSELPDRQRRYAEVIARSGQSLVTIINDILDFSKIEAGKLTLERIPFSLPDLVDTVVALFAEKAAAKGLDLAAFVDPSLPETMTGDPVRLTQVLSNLVNNALKFTAAGHVMILAELTDGRLRLSVNDTGIGIPADKVGSLFSAFSQADQSTTRRFGGTGLGLAISKRIADAMDGRLWVESVDSQGSSFIVVLPLSDAIPPRAAVPRPLRSIAVALSGSATAETMARSLAAAGFDVQRAGSQGQADATADLLVDASNLLRAGRPAGSARVVAVALAGNPDGAEALRLGLADRLLFGPVAQADRREVMAWLKGEYVSLPAVAREMIETTPAAELAGLRVLVVDDSPVNLEVAVEALSRLGVLADTADSGSAALAVSAERDFDVILMDGSMPEMDGYETTRQLRAQDADKSRAPVTVIALTAHVVGSAAALWREAGMNDVLHKPFTVAGLAEVLQRNFTSGVAAHLPTGLKLGAAPTRRTPAPLADLDELLDEDTLSGLDGMAASASDGFLRRIVMLFADGAPQCFADLRRASADRDATAVASSSHKLKSMSMNVGATRLASRLAAVEVAALDNAAIPGDSIIDEAEAVFRSSLAALRNRFEAAQQSRAA